MAGAVHDEVGAEAADDLADAGDARPRASLYSSMSTVASAPNLRASSSRGASGAPTQMTRPAPISCAAAMARMPIGPVPWMTTVSPHLNRPYAARGQSRGCSRGDRLRQRAEAQRHVVRQLVDLGARQHPRDRHRRIRPSRPRDAAACRSRDSGRSRPASGSGSSSPDSACSSSSSPQGMKGGIMIFEPTVIGMSIQSVFSSGPISTDDAGHLVAEGEGPGQRLRPMALQDVQVGAADAAGADLDQGGLPADIFGQGTSRISGRRPVRRR